MRVDLAEIAANWDRQVIAGTPLRRVQVRVIRTPQFVEDVEKVVNAYLKTVLPQDVRAVDVNESHVVVTLLEAVEVMPPLREITIESMGLPRKTLGPLRNRRIEFVDQALRMTSGELLAIRNFGPASFVALHDALVRNRFISGMEAAS